MSARLPPYLEPPRRRGLQSTIVTLFLIIVALAALFYLLSRSALLGQAPSAPLERPVAGANRPESVTPTPAARAAAGAPSPAAAPTPSGPRPPVEEAVARYFKAWEERRYEDMYRQVNGTARQGVTAEAFVNRYRAISSGVGVTALKIEHPRLVDPPSTVSRAEARYVATHQSARFGEIKDENILPLVFEDGEWRVAWTPDLIFKGMGSGGRVEVIEDNPTRGSIFDRRGAVLATTVKAPTIGVVPAALKDKERTIGEIASYMQVDAAAIRRKIEAAQPEWYVQLGLFRPDKKTEVETRFGKFEGVIVEERDVRHYPHGETAAHIIGYVSPILASEVEKLAQNGYGPEDLIGRGGVEAHLEEALLGQRGGRVSIVDASGSTVRVLAEKPVKHGGHVHLTLDVEIQKKAEQILGDKTGSLVLMDPRDNSIVAMATNPRFDPNGFVFGFSSQEWQRISTDPRHPLQNRPALSAYPTGSIFKVITMAAGMERGGYQTNSQFTCTGKWMIPNTREPVFGDWVPQGHGRLDLSQGLVESCDIVFYELGLRLEKTNTNLLPDMARQFGMGERTGVRGIDDAPGTLPSPDWKKSVRKDGWYPGDAVNLAIGQGYLEATPLQMANVYTTLASGGRFRTPLLVRRIVPNQGNEPAQEFQAEEKRRVPVSDRTLVAIRDAMKNVTSAPRGTALYAFQGYRIPIAGKTGSAENQAKEAHAWYAGWGPADRAELVVIAMVEGGEMGGRVAAPLGRQAFEAVLGR